jgi:hypothetical protein
MYVQIKIAGIYKIEHISGYYYIGLSVDIFSRWSSHYINIKTMKHSSTEFQSLWLNSKPSDWSFCILEYVSITEYKNLSKMKGKSLQTNFRRHLLKLEKQWMSKYSINYSLNKDKKHFS